MSTRQLEYYSTRQAAELLGVAISTVQLWTNNGILDAWITGGGHRRIKRSSVEQIINQQNDSEGNQSINELSVVIVEDNAQQQRMYKKQFEAWTINTKLETATDGYEGMLKIGATIPDVIITDLIMPNLDGFQLIRALNKMPELENSLIIVVTGLTKEIIKESGGLPSNVNLFLKPTPFSKLEELLQEKANSKANFLILE